jgi:hypothetical protein
MGLAKVECHIPDSTTVTPAVPTTRLSSLATETLASRRTPRKIPENNHPNTPEQRSTTQTRKPRTNRPVKRHQPSTRSSNIAREIKKPVPPPPSEINIKHLKPGIISEHFFVRVIPLSAKLPEQPSLVSSSKLLWFIHDCGEIGVASVSYKPTRI